MLKAAKSHYRVLILMPYFDRPNMVRNALHSILWANKFYSKWYLAFCDDGSKTPGEPIVRDVLQDHLDKVFFYNTESTPEEKVATGGSIGQKLNEVVDELDADIITFLADDDAIHPMYLYNLSNFFLNRQGVMVTTSLLINYKPMQETFVAALRNKRLGVYQETDISSLAWRAICHDTADVKFANNSQKEFASHFVDRLLTFHGPAINTDFKGQFKGVHQKQLSVCGWKWATAHGELLDTKVIMESLPVENDPVYKAVNISTQL